MENSRYGLAWGMAIFLMVFVRHYSVLMWSKTFQHGTLYANLRNQTEHIDIHPNFSTNANAVVDLVTTERKDTHLRPPEATPETTNLASASISASVRDTGTRQEKASEKWHTRPPFSVDHPSTTSRQYKLESIIRLQDVASVRKSTVSDLPGVPRICFVSCVSSKGFRNMPFSKTALKTVLLKSLKSTIEPKYRYTLFIGFDKTDTYWNAHMEEIINFFHDRPFIDVELLTVKGGSFSKAINGIAAYAHSLKKRDDLKPKGKCNYYIRINDDSQFASHGWTTMAVEQLAKYQPQNVGVVGPTVRQGNTNILVFDFVHRLHLDIFDTYYPAQLSNWWIDDWITQIYRPNNMKKLPLWRMNHVMKHGQRYSVNGAEKKLLSGLVKGGKKSISEYKANHTFVELIHSL
jgi:hypothetical protein